jgi:hypothetical protein
MRQTPAIEVPMTHGDWLTQPLVTYGAPPSPQSTPAASDQDAFDSFLQSLGIGS